MTPENRNKRHNHEIEMKARKKIKAFEDFKEVHAKAMDYIEQQKKEFIASIEEFKEQEASREPEYPEYRTLPEIISERLNDKSDAAITKMAQVPTREEFISSFIKPFELIAPEPTQENKEPEFITVNYDGSKITMLKDWGGIFSPSKSEPPLEAFIESETMLKWYVRTQSKLKRHPMGYCDKGYDTNKLTYNRMKPLLPKETVKRGNVLTEVKSTRV